MSWYSPEKYAQPIVDVNKEFLNLKGELDEKQAKITFAKFLYRNIGFTADLLCGIKLYPDQIINIKGMLQSNYSLCIKSRGGGKCLLYNNESQILTKEHGLIALTKLIPDVDFSEGERWIDLSEFNIWNGSEWSKVTRALVQTQIPSIRVTTSNGYSVAGSSNHLIKTWDKISCEIKWKRYYEINTEDYICVNHKEASYPETRKEDVDIKEAYLIGLLLGDGCFTGDSFTITSADEEILSFIEKYPVGNRIIDPRSSALTIRFKSEFSRFLTKKYNLKLNTSYTKEIPEFILKDRSLTIACIRGLFDTDGYVNKDALKLEYCSTSITMAKQVHNVLNLLGIVSRMKLKTTPSPFGKAYYININGKQALLFHEKIGFGLTRKRERVSTFLGRGFNVNKDVIPGLLEYFNKKYKVKYKSSEHDITNQNFSKFANYFRKKELDTKDSDLLNSIQENKFYFDKVSLIEDLGNQNCIDFNVPNGEMYWGNGFINHNTFDAAVFCILQCIFFPGSTILIAGPTFRTARFIFNYIEKVADSTDAKLLFQAMGVKSKRNDEFRWRMNEGEIVAIPLNGEKIRGFRANILVIDEFLLMNEDMVEKVLMPYLVAPQDIKERQIIREKEDYLIRKGVLKESERIKFENKAKFIGLSSASYTCEYLYKKYDEFVKKIYEPEMPENGAKYFVSQLAWDAMPIDRIDKSIIEMAQGNESNQATFKREYGAQFIDGSDSYFSMKKMIECTIPDGESPCLLLQGGKNSKYILSIDPNFSNSPTSDNFAMCVIEIDDDKIQEGKISGTVVHNYAKSGKDLKDHIKYFHYIWTHFNISLIIIDYAGYQFLEAANESEYFRKDNVEIKIFDFYSEKDGVELEEQLKYARKNMNKEIYRIAFNQYFTTDFIRKGNENLQGCIDYKKIWFGSGIKANVSNFESATSAKIDLDMVDEDDMTDFIDSQEILIRQVKYECASIEVKSTAKGTQSFDLPQIMKRDSSPKRMRKDSYTALMLGCWGLKCYYDIMKVQEEDTSSSFEPILF